MAIIPAPKNRLSFDIASYAVVRSIKMPKRRLIARNTTWKEEIEVTIIALIAGKISAHKESTGSTKIMLPFFYQQAEQAKRPCDVK
ncbi:MAG: hypothetical protein V1668_01290 [Patescibacteria group bacterium]